MSPELIAAVKERFELGYSVEAVKAELATAGHPDSVIKEVLQAIQSNNDHAVSDKVDASEVPIQGSAPAELPSARSLIAGSFSFVLNRLDLVLLVTIPSVIMLILQYVTNVSVLDSQNITTVLVKSLDFVTLVFSLLIMGVVLYVVSESPARTATLSEGWSWTKKNIVGLIWVYTLSVLVIYGGALFFVIPGIVLLFLIYFAQYIYVKEGVQGLDALLRSRDLVKGNGWLFFKRALALVLFFGLFLVMFSNLGWLAIGFTMDGKMTLATIIQILMNLVSSLIVVMILHIGMELYRSMVAIKPPAPNAKPASGKRMYQWLAIIGACVILFIIVGGIYSKKQNVYNKKMFDEYQQNLSTKERAAELRTYDNLGEDNISDCLESEMPQ